MSYLLDTCCISELVKKNPNPDVEKWIASQDEQSMYLSVITFGELRKGIEKLPDSKKKKELSRWINEDLNKRFKNRIINITMDIANKWGEILATAEKQGRSLPAIDSLLAATALVNDLTIVTRNTQDMDGSGVDIINPWSEKPNK
jgi:predicted nucleic acid-binding protein